jgi:Fungal chitosanase of glycosyl hydrolase group 75
MLLQILYEILENMKLEHFLNVADGTEIFVTTDDSYMTFIGDLDVCTDGTGNHYGDYTSQDQTAYTPYLNADVDYYIVLHPKMRTGVKPVVLGCMGRVTNLRTYKSHWGVWGEVGPADKTGEAAICMAQFLNPHVSANVGDSNKIYLYECWPGIPAKVNGKQYKLIPAG